MKEEINKEIELFNNETSKHEVFAIKHNEEGVLEAFVGYKIPNGNFHFEGIPYTGSKKDIVLSNFSKEFLEYIKHSALANNVFHCILYDGDLYNIIEQIIINNETTVKELKKYVEKYGIIK